MTCLKCGGALQAAGAHCMVCDPWAVPVSDSAPGAPALPPPGQLATAPLPNWLTRLIRRNPPAPADLEQAFRRSVILWSGSGVYLLWAVASFLMIAVRSAVPVALTGLLGLLAVLVIVSRVFRNRTWISRAVAVVGTRPDIGYHWFAGIPQLVRRNQVVQGARLLLIVFVGVRLFVLQPTRPDSAAPQLILLAAYFMVALCALAATAVLEVGAAAVLNTRLNQSTKTPIAAALDQSSVI